jgi:hypothetical protein
VPSQPAATVATVPSAISQPAATSKLPLTRDARELESKFKRYWYNYAKRCVNIDGKYYICQSYDPRYFSSRKLTIAKVTSAESKKVTVGTGLIKRTKVIKPRREDVDAYVKAIPGLGAGQYGYIYSAQIIQVHGPFDVTIGDIYLGDASIVTEYNNLVTKINRAIAAKQAAYYAARRNDPRRFDAGYVPPPLDVTQFLLDAAELERRFIHRKELILQQRRGGFVGVRLRLKGQPTVGMSSGARWYGARKGQGVQIAVVGKGMAIPAANLKTRMKEAEVLQILAIAGISKQQFVDKVVASMQQFPGKPLQYEPHVFQMISSGLANPRAIPQGAPTSGVPGTFGRDESGRIKK